MTGPIRCRTAADLTRHLAAIRRERGLTQQDVADMLDASRAQLCQRENGHVIPNLDMAIRHAAALGYDLALIPRPPYLVDVPLPDKDVES